MECNLETLEKVAQQLRRSMWRGVAVDAAEEAGISVCRFGPVQATVVQRLPEDRCLNRIQGASEADAVSGGHLAAAVEWMDSQRVEYSVSVTERRPGSIRAAAFLSNRGFTHDSASVTYVRDVLPPDEGEDTSVKIYKLSDQEVSGFGLCQITDDVFALAPAAWALIFPLPMVDGWHCYTAASRDEALAISACGAMYTHDGVARFGIDATIETARRKGLNRALLHRRLLDAAGAGCQLAIAEIADTDRGSSVAMGRSLTSIGFVRGHRTQCWARPISEFVDGGPEGAHWLGL
jgi:hypothetical protein